jgi:hypothetical protein
VGTGDYMSPEQVKGLHVDGRSDLFSVGCVLYEVLAGPRPFHSDNLMTIFYKITHEEPDYSRLPAEHQALVPIIKKSLAKDLEARYQSAYDFAMDLRGYLSSHASSASGQRALDSVGEIEPPSGSHAVPLTSPPVQEPTIVTDGDSTEYAQTGGMTGPGRTTLKGPATVAPTALLKDAPTARRPPRPATRPPATRSEDRPTVVIGGRPTAPSSSKGPLLIGGGVLALVVVAGGAYFLLKPQQPQVVPTSVPPASAPASVPAATLPPVTAPPATTLPPVTAPPASLNPKRTAANATLDRASAELRSTEYTRAMTDASQALDQDPGNERAKRVLDEARQGQKAQDHIRAAEAALARHEDANALQEAHFARDLYASDPRINDLIDRIAKDQGAPPPLKAVAPPPAGNTQVASLLDQADAAMGKKDVDLAVSLYQKVLDVDPSNVVARSGKSNAAALRAVLSAAPAAGGGGAHSFSASATSATAPDTASDGGAPPGFDSTSGVTSKKVSEAAALPGKITFEYPTSPVQPGDPFKIKIILLNEGNAPISVKRLNVKTIVNGRGAGGAVPLLATTAAPRQKTLLFQIDDTWKQESTSWSLEVQLTTDRNEIYKSQLTWK